MDVAEIRKLIRLMEEAGLTELEIEDRSGKVRLVRGAGSRARAGAAAWGEGEAEEPPPRGRDGAVRGPLDADASGAGEDDEGIERIPPGMSAITSPMVGTFYRSPSPDALPFVNPGDTVHAGQVVCIIEAMKMMNEVTAEAAGRIVSVQVENGAAVEYGSPLFLLELAE